MNKRAAHTGAKMPRRRVPIFAIYAALIAVFSAYVVLDTFVFSHTYAMAVPVSTSGQKEEQNAANASSSQKTDVTASGFESEDVRVELTTTTYLNTTVYVADVYTSDVTNLLAAFAQDAYGHNVSDVTSSIAKDHGATLAINGDCYGMRNEGYVIRNGVLYRSESAGSDQEDLAVFSDGSFQIVREADTTAEELLEARAWHVFSFGPGLVEDKTVIVDAGDEVGHAKASNPRTAIGKVSDGHYVFVVSDGRTQESEGLSLAELATFMQEELGVECAYNLDGGGSSTMWFNGELVNNPTTSGHSIKERGVTDIVYLTV